MANWRLSPGVFAASVDGDLGFLDARSNAYSCIPRTEAGTLVGLLEGELQASDDNRSIMDDLQ